MRALTFFLLLNLLLPRLPGDVGTHALICGSHAPQQVTNPAAMDHAAMHHSMADMTDHELHAPQQDNTNAGSSEANTNSLEDSCVHCVDCGLHTGAALLAHTMNATPFQPALNTIEINVKPVQRQSLFSRPPRSFVSV